jgi:hypothetical protein
MGGIIPADFAMFAAVQAIIAADAGEKARTETAAAAINVFVIWNLVLKTSALLAHELRIPRGKRFSQKANS